MRSFARERGEAALGPWKLDLRSHGLTTSTNFWAAFGRGLEAPFSREDLRAAIHAEDREQVGSTIAQSIAERADYDVEYRAVRPDGTVCWL
ncbi:hypothetical protein EAH89_27255 [Roseomonas nepalensis]|uniref:PAS fold-3 domain-containing protein n=1 Tax=Muricoccus nepalensis TaxID=1854500 RepID=A0A502F3A5_9PROT|nr:hypothetical protein EAH89_27255 [Roseomonas nepalensis]